MYSQGTSMPNPLPLFTAFPHTLTIPLAPGFARKCRKSPTPFVVLANLNGTCPTTRLFLTTETAFLSFGFSGSGTSCKVSPFLGVHHPWYTWNPLIQQVPASANIAVVPCKRTQQVTTLLGPTMLGVVGQQCCVRLHGPKSLTSFKLYATSTNKCQHCCGSMQTDATSHNIVGANNVGCCWPTMLRPFAWALS